MNKTVSNWAIKSCHPKFPLANVYDWRIMPQFIASAIEE